MIKRLKFIFGTVIGVMVGLIIGWLLSGLLTASLFLFLLSDLPEPWTNVQEKIAIIVVIIGWVLIILGGFIGGKLGWRRSRDEPVRLLNELKLKNLLPVIIALVGVGTILTIGWWVWSNRPLPKVGWPVELEVTITTDKTEYKQGEIVKITVRNDSGRSIWYNEETCPPFCVSLQKLENDQWVSAHMAIKVVSDLPVRPSSLEPNKEISREWDMFVVKPVDQIITAEGGKYRFSFYYGLSEDDFTEKTIYSNEFTVKGKEIFLEEKGCQRDEDCKGTCDWDCINKDYLPKKYTCELIPPCWCVNNQCIHIPNREGHQGMLQIIFSPKVMLGKNPIETKEKISRFIISTNLGIDIIGDVNDLNIIRSITIYSKGINADLIEKIRNDPLVKDFKEWAYLPETLYHKAGSTYLIEFGEGLYREDLQEFVTKYPKIKDNLVRDYWDYTTYPLQPIFVTVNVPVGEEDKFIAELKIRYQSEILEVEMLPFE